MKDFAWYTNPNGINQCWDMFQVKKWISITNMNNDIKELTHGIKIVIPEPNIHSNESFPVNWEYIKQTINPRTKCNDLLRYALII